ncbi:MAG: orotate phosphoribosyltransferase [Leptolyngbyaceae bacterium]|nr:orotate phosphoribosyltransferase [Leptolyngbyaceae bacterium]
MTTKLTTKIMTNALPNSTPDSTGYAYSYGDRLPHIRQTLLDLFCTHAYREGEFVLSAGKTSSYYINGKLVTLHPQGGRLVGQLLLPLIPPSAVAVAGLTLGADPIVAAVNVVADYEGRSLTGLIVRKEAKGHGTKLFVEGPTLSSGSSVIVLEDVVTTGKSAMVAVERLRDMGYHADHVISLVDRLEGGAEFYQSQNIKFQAVFTIPEIQSRWQKLK